MRTSESIVNITKAMSAAQGEIKNPEANEEVKVYAKKDAGGGLLYTYKYATLPKCFDAVRGPFSKNGLSHSAAIVLTDKGADLVVRISHESGEWYEASVPLSAGGDAKARAGEITFWKRYLFNGLAGIAGDDDIREENGERGPVKEENGKPASKPAAQKAAAPAAKPAQNVQKTVTQPASNEKAKTEVPNFATDPAPSLKRARGVIVKDILDAAGKLGIGADLDPPDVMVGLGQLGNEMFKLPLEKISDDDLEKMLAKLNNDMRGK
jgi:hypothetical protein